MAWLVWTSLVLTNLVAWTSAAALRQNRRATPEPTPVQASAVNLEELAEVLDLDYACLSQPFPSDELTSGDVLLVPLTCCRSSCQGDICGQRIECSGDTASASPTAASTAAVPNVAVTITGQSVFTTVAGSSTYTLSFPTPLETQTTITTDGLTVTVGSSRTAAPSDQSSAVGLEALTLTTELSDNGEPTTLTFPEPITARTTVTSNSETFTIDPISASTDGSIATTNSGGPTVLSESNQGTVPSTGPTRQTTASGSGGVPTTLALGSATAQPTTQASDTPGAFLFPITTTVPEPKPTDGGTVIPCDLWFFDSCLRWDDFPIWGWKIDLPPGIRSPGPPPPIRIDPGFPVRIGFTGKLPDWPAITIGPDSLPTYDPKPKSECQTESAEMCATSTSYAVTRSGESTITSDSKTLSTCATVYGCKVQGTSTETATTSGCIEATTAANGDVACATSVPYFISSRSGTDKSVFEAYVNKLPDNGKGHYLSFPNTPWQSYITNLTLEQAEQANKQPFMYFVKQVTEPPVDPDDVSELPPSGNTIERRLFNKNLRSRKNSEPHLKMISAKKSKNLFRRGKLADYTFDPLLGKGQTIYIVDDGFNLDHDELKPTDDRKVGKYFVPRSITLPNMPEGNMAPDDIKCYTRFGHGTHVASIAGGLKYGVASKANLVLVKHKSAAINPRGSGEYINRMVTDEAMENAWNWIVEDVLRKRAAGDKGKFIINMSGGVEYAAREGWAGSRKNEIMERVLKECAKNNIIVVVAAGNDGKEGSLKRTTPQNLGRPDNELITVGAVYNDGRLMELTTRDQGDGGSISVYAVGEWVLGAGPADNSDKVRYQGTSQASPAVAGLAAYFASLPSLSQEWRPGHVAMDMKNYIVKYAHKRLDNPVPAEFNYPIDPESIKVIYNRANEGLCARKNPPGKRNVVDEWNSTALHRRQDGSETDIVVDGVIVDPEWVDSYCDIAAVAGDAASGSAPAPTAATSLAPPAATLTDLPDLPTGISTPAGSSCVSTTSQTQCVLGHGGTISTTATACVTTPACASWASTGSAATTSAPPAPTVNTDSGILTCSTATKTGNDTADIEFFFTGGEMDHARDTFCANMTNNDPPIRFELGQTELQYGSYASPSNPNNPIYVAASWDAAAAGANCPAMSFAKNDDGGAYRLCQERMDVVIHNCGKYEAGTGVPGLPGGQFFRDCITWEITSLHAVET